MKQSLQEALNNVEMTYAEISSVADDILQEHFAAIDTLVNSLRNDAENMTPENLRHHIVQLQLKSYEFSTMKEKAISKADCAQSLRKEKQARAFNEAQGTQGVKENIALLASSEETVIETLYSLISNLMKTKLDEVHRLIDSCKSILMSKMQEMKMVSSEV